MEAVAHFNPFPGLRSFEEDEDYLFFGREEQTDELLKKLSSTHFLAVIGTSGSGKSSLVKSGLLPFLHSGYMARAGSSWRVALSRPGNDPIGNVAESLAKNSVLYPDADEAAESMYAAIIESTLRRSTLGLAEAVKQSGLAKHENLLIVIDQFEELFRFNRYEKKNEDGKRDSLHFINLLLTASHQREVPIYVVFTMRSDFLGECTQFRGLPEAINEGQYLIPRMTREERKSAIVGPISVGGAQITPRLLTRLLNDVGDNSDQLPILQHALMRTWDHWEAEGNKDEPIDLQHYEAIGAMEKGLSLHAEEAYSELKTDRQRQLCESLFKSLTDKGASGQGIRRPCALSEICAIANADIEEIKFIIEIFRKPGISFLMPPADIPLSESTIIDISHESLMRVWTRLIQWEENETQSAEIYLRLSEAAALYHEGKTDLWSGPELQLTLNWKEESKLNDVWANRYDKSYERAFLFLEYSKNAYHADIEEKENRRKAVLKRTRLFATILGIAFLISILILIYAIDQQQKAKQSEQVALIAKGKAEKATIKADSLLVVAVVSGKAEEKAKVEALAQKDNAIREKERAERLKVEADDAKNLAISSEREAVRMRNKAESEKSIADSLRIEAIEQRKAAIELKDLADKSRIEADSAKVKAERLHLLEMGHSVALQTLRINKNEEPELTALLAYTAFQFNKKHGGDVNNPDIFNALNYASENREDNVFDKHEDAVRVLEYNRDGNYFATGGDDGKIMLWRNEKSRTPFKIYDAIGQKPHNVRAIQFFGKKIIVSTAGGNLMALNVDGPIGQEAILMNKDTSTIRSFDVSNSGNELIAGNTNGELLLWESGDIFSTPKVLTTVNDIITAVRFVPGKNEVVIATNNSGIVFYNLSGNKTSTIGNKQKVFLSLEVSSDGNWIATGTTEGRILIWNLLDLTTTYKELNGHESGVHALSFDSSNLILASAGGDALIKLWDMENLGKEPRTLSGHNTWVWDIAFNADGSQLFSGGSDNNVRSWVTDSRLLASKLCAIAGRSLTQDEWNLYIGTGADYENFCKE